MINLAYTLKMKVQLPVPLVLRLRMI